MGSHQWQSAAALESLVRAFVVLSQLVPEPTRGTYTLVLGWLAKGAQQLQEHQKEEKEWKGRDAGNSEGTGDHMFEAHVSTTEDKEFPRKQIF